MSDNGTNRPLSHFPDGTLVRLGDTHGCCRARGRLCAMGLTPGTVCRVYAGGRCGPCRIRVRETDVVIGHGMAEKIMASEVENQAGGEKQQSG